MQSLRRASALLVRQPWRHRTRTLFTHLYRARRPVPGGWGTQRGGVRGIGTGLGLLPRGLFFRAFWTGITAGVGYVYYKLHQASSWLEDKREVVSDWGLATLLGMVDAWTALHSASLALGEEYSAWNPFGRSKTPGGSGSGADSSTLDVPRGRPSRLMFAREGARGGGRGRGELL